MSKVYAVYKYWKRWLVTFLAGSLTLPGCVVPLENSPGAVQDIVVIEGFIDDDFGPHQVKVTAIAPFVSIQEGGAIRRLDAVVKIFDDLGNVTELSRITSQRTELFPTPPNGGVCGIPGIRSYEVQSNYLTPPSFRGVPGRSYSLEVEIDELDKTYRSSFVKLMPSVPIDSLFFEFRFIPGPNDLQPRFGVDVLGSWQDPGDTEDYYMWEFEGTYRLETFSLCNVGLGFECAYDPRDDFGEECWVVEQNVDANLNLLSDTFFDGRRAVEKIGFIEDDAKRFSSNVVRSSRQYHVKAEQYAVPKEAFDFYTVVGILSEIDGEIFDPPPVRPLGNILNIEEPSEIVIGYFGAFGKSTHSAFIDRSVLLDRKFHGTCGDCRYFQYNGQIEIPDVYR